MQIIGCDFHPSYQQIAHLDQETGEVQEVWLEHAGDQPRRFYAGLSGPVRVGMEASGNTRWFEQLLAELGHEVWLGDPAQIRALVVRRQKTDRRDAAHLLALLVDGRFPRIWTPNAEMRDARQLLVHRHKLVGVRRRVKNELQHLALNQGLRLRHRLWSRTGRQKLQQLPLTGWTAVRRTDLLGLLDQLDGRVAELDTALTTEAQRWPQVQLLRTHPGVGPVTGLAYVLTLGPVERFARSKQVVSYLGLNPREHSSGGRQRLGAISKQGNPLLRSWLVEAGHHAARHDPELRRDYQRLAARKHSAVAKVMIARKLAVRLYWMLRQNRTYAQLFQARMPGSPSHSVVAV